MKSSKNVERRQKGGEVKGNDVFISCKNLDEHKRETRDSEIAAEVYEFLTNKGLSIFLSTFTLEQLGVSDYTRAIDSALESAMVLLAIGTSADHLNSEWVRCYVPQAASGKRIPQGGYEASYGTYQLDEGANTFTFHVEGALVRMLIGKGLLRAYEFSGKQLIVKLANLNSRFRMTSSIPYSYRKY